MIFYRSYSKEKNLELQSNGIASSRRPPRNPFHKTRRYNDSGKISQRAMLSDSLRPLNTPHCSGQDITCKERKFHSTVGHKHRKRSRSETRTKTSLGPTMPWMDRNTSVSWDARPSSCESVTIYKDIKDKDAWQQLKIFQKKYLEGERKLLQQQIQNNGHDHVGEQKLTSYHQNNFQNGQKRSQTNVNASKTSFYQDRDFPGHKNHRFSANSSRYNKSYYDGCSNETMRATVEEVNDKLYQYETTNTNEGLIVEDVDNSYKDDSVVTSAKSEDEEMLSSNQEGPRKYQQSTNQALKYNYNPRLFFPGPPTVSKTPTSVSNSRSSSTSNRNRPILGETTLIPKLDDYRKSFADQSDSHIVSSNQTRGRSRCTAAKKKRYNSYCRNSQLLQERRRNENSFTGGASSHESMPILQDSLPIAQQMHHRKLKQQKSFPIGLKYDQNYSSGIRKENDIESLNLYRRSHSQPPRYI